jgi:hypothetical protein
MSNLSEYFCIYLVRMWELWKPLVEIGGVQTEARTWTSQVQVEILRMYIYTLYMITEIVYQSQAKLTLFNDATSRNSNFEEYIGSGIWYGVVQENKEVSQSEIPTSDLSVLDTVAYLRQELLSQQIRPLPSNGFANKYVPMATIAQQHRSYLSWIPWHICLKQELLSQQIRPLPSNGFANKYVPMATIAQQ